MSSPDFYLVLDAGGSSSRGVLLKREGWQLMAAGRGGPVNITQDDERTIKGNLLGLVDELLEGSQTSLTGVQGVVVGVAGWFSARWEEGKRLIHTSFEEAGFDGELRIIHDSLTAWSGATGGKRPSVVVYSGTGSFAYGESETGETAHADILGPLLGDAGSGYWIGLKGLRAALESREGRGEKTSLEDLLPEVFGTAEVGEIVKFIWETGLSRREIASTTPLIARAAEAGDTVSKRIFTEAACKLADSALSVGKRLARTPDDKGKFDLYYSGGVFSSGQLLIAPLAAQLQKQWPGVKLEPARYGPLVGALLRGTGQEEEQFGAEQLQAIEDAFDG
ncbi:MAG: BadF/BadG/BcrA/BcrD ATPase family protein [Candidatus Bipolaricaulota bacterium]